ncbi:hypothetical protein [Halostreptopolyspora alba]|uniref:Uncharacterized protein n=1 Tax=Halostreptopolyspora alba TaxID=2487137 RepID=A0A3N0DYM4_9ACTN|nr:hypothetical protein EFW17_22515 [Nocardiopsaceae bacterium YIM 96095]
MTTPIDPRALVGQWVRLARDDGPPTIGVLVSVRPATGPDGHPMWNWRLRCSQGTTIYGGGGLPITLLAPAHRADIRRARRHLRRRRDHYTALALGHERQYPQLAHEATMAASDLESLQTQLASHR